jgi:transposase
MQSELNVRELRGIDIAARYTIKQENGFFFVPSSSGKSERFKVCLNKQKCTCPDHEIRRNKCKHIFAAEYCFEQDFLSELTTQETVIPETYIPPKKTYSQDWKAYDKAQTCEKSEFQYLLAELCKGAGEPSQTKGRPRLPLEDMIFSCVYKVYSLFSLRRFTTDLKEAKEKGFITRAPNNKSVARYFGMELLTPYLKMLIEESSLPLVEIEKHFAVDASGLSTSQGFTWLHAKYTEPRLINKKDWLKIHICCGTKTNIISAVEVTERFEADSNYFEPLVKATAQNFEMQEISADKGYLSKANLQTAVENNAIPFIAWKANSRATNKEGNHLWNRLYHWFGLNQEKFFEHYHRRSNVETTFMMLKSKFGGSLRSKTRTAQINEALCKILAHNICVLNQSMFELDVKPEFWKEI